MIWLLIIFKCPLKWPTLQTTLSPKSCLSTTFHWLSNHHNNNNKISFQDNCQPSQTTFYPEQLHTHSRLAIFFISTLHWTYLIITYMACKLQCLMDLPTKIITRLPLIDSKITTILTLLIFSWIKNNYTQYKHKNTKRDWQPPLLPLLILDLSLCITRFGNHWQKADTCSLRPNQGPSVNSRSLGTYW